MLLNICLAQLRKYKCFLNIHSLIFDISLGLTSSSSFSLAERAQTGLRLLRGTKVPSVASNAFIPRCLSCVSCSNFNLLRSLKVGCTSEKFK